MAIFSQTPRPHFALASGAPGRVAIGAGVLGGCQSGLGHARSGRTDLLALYLTGVAGHITGAAQGAAQ